MNKTLPSNAGGAGEGSCSSVSAVEINHFAENPRTDSPARSFTTTLTGAMTSATTLSGLAGNCLLQSDLFSLTTDTRYPSSVLKPTASTARYVPTQPQFQQLNAFYHATSLRNLMVSLGADLSSGGRFTIDAHCSVQDNAYYSPSSRKVCLGYTVVGSKFIWAADDADVVIHESGHGVNHSLASTAILNSSGEAGAIDEGVADYWALTVLDDAELSEWFLGALGAGYIRDASDNHLYPNSMIYQVHSDSRVIAQVLWTLRDPSNLGAADADELVKLAMQALPATTRFKDFYQALYDASGPGFLNLAAPKRNLIVTEFTNKGIHRVDSAAGLRLSTAGGGVKQVYVIDDYSYEGIQRDGNCNGQLDVGETALVMVNLENPGADRMGMGVATLGAAPAGIQVPSGGGLGEFFRFNAGADFASSLPAGSGSNYSDAVYAASFLIRATSAGVKNLSLDFTPMYADATGLAVPGATETVAFSLTVGSVGPISGCTDWSLWP